MLTTASEDVFPAAGEIYLTRAQAAAYLQVGVATLAKRHMVGTGPIACKLGRSVRYRRSDLDAWMLNHCSRSTVQAADA